MYNDDDFLDWIIRHDKKSSKGMEQNNIKNYMRFTDFSLFSTHYAYIDVAEYYADEYIRKRKIRIKFGRELSHPDHGYRIILCKIPKWQEHQFVLAMEEPKNKMLICGHADYLDFCKDLRDKMRAVNNGSGSDGQT